MSYPTLEASVDSGRPIELFEFNLNGYSWRYTNADQDLLAGAQTWTKAAITGDTIKQTGEAVNDSLSMDVPSWIAPAQMFMTSPPSRPIAVTIYYKHVGSADLVVAFSGEITQVNFPLPGKARITCESLASTMSREGLRLAWQRSCPYALYDPLTCKVDKNAWKVAFRVILISGFEVGLLLADKKTNDYFNGGFMEWNHPIRGIEYLPVDAYGAVATPATDEPNGIAKLLLPPGELFEGATGFIYPGCDFTPAKCQFYGNYDNYGGHPDMPGKSPFDGNPFF